MSVLDEAIAQALAKKENDVTIENGEPPAGALDSAILAATAAKNPSGAEAEPTEPTEPGFFQRLGSRMSDRGEDFNEIVDAFQNTDQGLQESMLQVFGKVIAGGALDIVGEGVSTVAGGAFDLLSKGVDATVSEADQQAVANLWDQAVGSNVIQGAKEMAGEGINNYRAWVDENPNDARTIEAIANIGLVMAPVRVKGPTAGSKPTIVSGAAKAADAAAARQTADSRLTFVSDLIRPRSSKKVRETEIKRTMEGGLISPRTVILSPQEKNMAQAVSSLPGVTNKNTMLTNLNVIQTEIVAEAKALTTMLENSTVKIPRRTITQQMDNLVTNFQNHSLLVGDAAKTGERVASKARELMAAAPNTPIGIFNARKEFDAWVKTQRPKIFDPATESALSIAVRDTRTEMNKIVAQSVPNVAVKDLLAKQSNLFRAVDNIGPKAADEAGTAIKRLGQRVAKSLGLKRTLSQNLPQVGAAAFMAGGSLLAPLTAASVGGIVGLAYGGTKLAMSATTKRSIAKLLRQSERAIQVAKRTKKGDLLRQLRADRAAVIEIMRGTQEE